MHQRWIWAGALTGLLAFGCADGNESESLPQGGCPGADATDTGGYTPVPLDTGQGADGSLPVDGSLPTELAAGGEGVGSGEGLFGSPCDSNVDCESGYCVEAAAGFVCTKVCVDICPDGYTCKGTSQGPDVIFLCVPHIKKLCTPCGQDSHCGEGACLDIDGETQCAFDCATTDDCPHGFVCEEDATSAHEGLFCQPESGSCTCIPSYDGGQRSCSVQNEVGKCFGIQDCEPEVGWSVCNAAPASTEICDGLDNDCDGPIDEDLVVDAPCQIIIEGVGACEGTQVCFGPLGMKCQGATPEAEACDFKDNDCDGLIDEDFKAGELYATFEHCGTCFANCEKGFPNAKETACKVFGSNPQCVVIECMPGFIKANDFQCVSTISSACQPCSVDENCAGDGAACLDLAEGMFCGSACESEEECQTGYECIAAGKPKKQCVPKSGSCTCDGTNTDLSSACSVTWTPPNPAQPAYTCNGLRLCTADGWTECKLPTEACDGADNDCDGALDEDFKDDDQVYSQVEHCGGCNISCLALSFPNAAPACDVDGPVPVCGYTCTAPWVDVNDLALDGCECLPSSDEDLAGDGVDSNCDGIDGDVLKGVFVAKDGSDLAAGTLDAPVLTITEALKRAQNFAKRDVYVATGVYSEAIRLVDGVGVFGGYSSDFLDRDPLLFETALIGPEPADKFPATVNAMEIASDAAAMPTIVAGLTIFGTNAGNQPSANSYGIFIRNCGSKLTVHANRIFGGPGGAGLSGSSGTEGTDGKSGKAGKNAYDVGKYTSFGNRYCTDAADALGGGGGGQHVCPDGQAVHGGIGGQGSCPLFGQIPSAASNGASGTGPAGAGGAGGAAGYSGKIDTATDCNFCIVPAAPMTGGLGQPGVPGLTGSAGIGCNQNGSIEGGHWVGGAGADGGGGGHGHGGGGGGPGGGVDVIGKQCKGAGLETNAGGHDIGGSGGGGGSGGCGGSGGIGGQTGGGSFGIFVVYTADAVGLPKLTQNTLQRGTGGSGGAGGPGGAGGVGGAGAPGGDSGEGDIEKFCARSGAPGGNGGQGGHGGGGGGGCGGPSYGIYAHAPGAAGLLGAYKSQNTFLPGGAGGPGGSGGPSAGLTGSKGSTGQAANTNF